MASGAAVRTALALPAWSPCLWVRMTWPTADQSSPIPASPAWISSSLPATPVSTMAASPPRTKMYADTKPRLTLVQSAPPAAPDRGGLEAPATAEAEGPAPPPGPVLDPALAAAATDPLLDPLGAHPAIPRTAIAAAPRPRSARKTRRVSITRAMSVDGTADGSMRFTRRISPCRCSGTRPLTCPTARGAPRHDDRRAGPRRRDGPALGAGSRGRHCPACGGLLDGRRPRAPGPSRDRRVRWRATPARDRREGPGH